jgi:hypothetical protein
MNREGLELRWEAEESRKLSQCMRSFVSYHPVAITSNQHISVVAYGISLIEASYFELIMNWPDVKVACA